MNATIHADPLEVAPLTGFREAAAPQRGMRCEIIV